MRTEEKFSSLIYEYFLKRFQFQHDRYGDLLPPIDALSREFCVAEHTVKSALKRLQAEGYISMRNGRSTRVVFRQPPEEARRQARRFLSERWEELPDLVRSIEMTLTPLLAEGFRRMSGEELSALLRFSRGASMDDLLYVSCYAMRKLENQLAMNLFWEVAFYTGLPLLMEESGKEACQKQLLRAFLNRAAACRREGNADGLDGALREYYQESTRQAFDWIKRLVQPTAEAERVSFTWRIYREQPQVCYSLALLLLHDMNLGAYQEAAFLPSYEKMALRYGASVSTVRRAVSLLNSLGAARPENGRGTRIIRTKEEAAHPDLACPAVRRNLAFYYQAFDMMLYSCEEVFRAALDALTPEETAGLTERLEAYRRAGRCELTLCRLLLFAARHSPLRGVRRIYERIYGLFLLGYPLKLSQADTSDLDREEERLTESMLEALRAGDTARGAAVILRFLRREFPKAERFLLNHGIKPEELRINRSIRLLISELMHGRKEKEGNGE